MAAMRYVSSLPSRLALTMDAIERGLGEALSPVAELERQIDEFGRGERI
jgi:hypothetical protein